MDKQDRASGVATAAKDQAGQVGQTATDAGGQIAQTTKEQAKNVVGEATQQARDLVGEARAQVRDQAGTQKARAVDGLRSIGDELRQMADYGGQSGLAAEVARQAAQRAHGFADQLDRHEPAELLDQVRAYARRRPVAFLAGAAVLGVLAGRMTRNLASSGDSGPRRLTGTATTPELTTGAYPGGYETADYPTGSAGYPAGTGGYTAGTAGYPAGTEAYPAGVGGAEATPAPSEPAGGYEPVYPSDQPGGGFRPVGEPGYEPGYPAGPTTEPGAEDPTWRTP